MRGIRRSICASMKLRGRRYSFGQRERLEWTPCQNKFTRTMTSPLPAWRDHITGTVWFLGGMLITSVVIGAVVLATHSSDTPALAVRGPGDPASVEMVRCPASSTPETLISAAACGRIGALSELLVRGAEVGQTDARAEFRGRTALHHAVQRGDEAAVQLLLEAGAATDARDAHGNTPLHLLALAPDVAHPLYVARFLIDAGADIEVRNARRTHPARNARSRSPAHDRTTGSCADVVAHGERC